MVTVADLARGESLPAPITVEVTGVEWHPLKSRRAYVHLVDLAGSKIGFVDYGGAEISIDWTEGYRYRIANCTLQKGSRGHDLEFAPTSRTRIESLGPTDQYVRLLIIGDTHVGRTEHPGTGERIDPIGAFQAAVEYGIEQDIDAVVHVGDIFHNTATRLHTFFIDEDVFTPLADAEIPFYYVEGNHGASTGDDLLERREESLISNLDPTGVSIGSTVRLFGINHHPGGEIPAHELTFPDSVSEPVSVLVLHQTLQQVSGPGPKSVDLARIQQQNGAQFDFVISGHHHDATRTEWRGTPLLYTGAAEHMSTNTDPVDRVAWLVTVTGDEITCDRYDIPE